MPINRSSGATRSRLLKAALAAVLAACLPACTANRDASADASRVIRIAFGIGPTSRASGVNVLTSLLYSEPLIAHESKKTLRDATWEGTNKPVFTLPVALSVMVFFALCAQCSSTLVIMRRETGTWLWPLFTFGYMTALAYLGALVTYQVGMLFAG